MWAKAAGNEKQAITVNASGGTFSLSIAGVPTEPIAFDAPASAVEAALAGVAPIGIGNVRVTGGPGDSSGSRPYVVSFTGDLEGVNMAELVADGNALTGGAPSVAIATTVPVRNLTLVSRGDNTADPFIDVEGVLGSSADGRYVYFVAHGQVVANAPTLGTGVGVFVWHEGTVAYIGQLTRFGGDSTKLLDGVPLNLAQKQTQVTPDGRHLMFVSSSGDGLLSAHGGTDYDHGPCLSETIGCRQFYVYSADTNELRCATCRSDGAPGSGNAVARMQPDAIGGAQYTNYLSRTLSDDGRFAFFTTPEALVPEDVNGRLDAYEYDVRSGRVQLLSSGTDQANSYFLDASASGNDVFFATRERLVGWDDNQAYDIYDARVGGGFPEPVTPAPGCGGDACQGTPGNQAVAPVAGSQTTHSGDAAGGRRPPTGRGRQKRCRKGRVTKRIRGRVRCVRKAPAKAANSRVATKRRVK
jgi:hypothetical protein